ncbi:heparinase II/III domain-containing protein [Membranihabitans marinus]|uniref:heparinase II/III domain-containing protein n=1 Tax=Membranihabitans marinus TaxID=1227546 RepID=UPI001F17404E|nr:heparinase II/III family protein [Membranihabitans marinus]
MIFNFNWTGISVMFILNLSLISMLTASNSEFVSSDSLILENPMSPEYLKKNLRKDGPKLFFTPEIEEDLKAKIKSDPIVKNVYEAIKLNAASVVKKPLLKREKIGLRLLSVSREMLYRMNILSMVYRMEKDEEILERINEEVIAVCEFSDWNPSHYLDVAEMALAVAIALDWTDGALPKKTVALAKQTLIDKGILPSYQKKGFWVEGNNNWNQVCHGGLIAASLVIADIDVDLASKTISRALDGMPNALKEYGPDGVYPEGATYWMYGTSFSVMTASILESALGTDFGLGTFPGFRESALFKVLSEAQSGRYYNFADCGEFPSRVGDMVLAWFAAKTGNSMYLQKEKFLLPAKEMGKLPRYAGGGLIWLSQYTANKEKVQLPNSWQGDGANPVVFFRDDIYQYYFGGKGGRGTVNHGNMDAGSFVFELDGIRWIVDLGNQRYHDLEKTGFNLWNSCQDCERWTLLTKNNFGHSTLSVNDELHVVEGMANFIEFHQGDNPSATLDMSPTFKNQLVKAHRRFVKDGPRSLLIEDEIEVLPTTKKVVFQLMTTADIEWTDYGLTLHQEGKVLHIENVTNPSIKANVVQLDPPPLKLDRHMANLKRIEFEYPAWVFENGKGKIQIRLSGI